MERPFISRLILVAALCCRKEIESVLFRVVCTLIIAIIIVSSTDMSQLLTMLCGTDRMRDMLRESPSAFKEVCSRSFNTLRFNLRCGLLFCRMESDG